MGLTGGRGVKPHLLATSIRLGLTFERSAAGEDKEHAYDRPDTGEGVEAPQRDQRQAIGQERDLAHGAKSASPGTEGA